MLVIRTAGGVAVIIGRWHRSSATTCSQSNAESPVIVNGVTQNGPGGIIASEASDAYAVECIKGDDIPFPCIDAADRADGRIASGDAAVTVAQRHGSGDVGANLVALDDYASRSGADKDSVGSRVDYIAGARRAATDNGVQ